MKMADDQDQNRRNDQERQTSQYPPPPEDHNRGGYYAYHDRPPHPGDSRSPYPPIDPSRIGQYSDPRAAGHYPPPQGWPGYSYPPPGGPPQTLQPEPMGYRGLPPPGGPYSPYGYYGHAPHPQPAPAPRQRTAIACKYCRKRKIRCSGYEASNEGRCNNCVRFNQQCLFHPVSAQAAFVPAQVAYGMRNRDGGQPGDYRNGDQPVQLYGAHGQPLGPHPPPAPHDGAPHGYPPAGYPPSGYPNGPHHPPGPGHQYDYRGPAPQDDNVSRKRPPPDDDPHNQSTHSSQSPHPAQRARKSTGENRANSNSGYDYPDPTNIAPTSPATSTMSYQSHPPAGYYTNGGPPPPASANRHDSPTSAHSYDSPRTAAARTDGRTPPPKQPNSAGSSSAGNRSMSVRDMLGPRNSETRDKNDNDMLNKLDGKAK